MRFWRGVGLALLLTTLLMMGLGSQVAMASTGWTTGGHVGLSADADGDGLPDDLDPDDDNDGISDENEASPNPQPDNGGIGDDDDDTIPNDLDPDDDNNGVTDDDDASAPPPANNGGTSGGPGGSSAASGSTVGGSTITALPVTGAGSGGEIPVRAFAIAAVILLLLATIPLARGSDDRPRR